MPVITYADYIITLTDANIPSEMEAMDGGNANRF